jgi:1-acyl-sn-glycerol-3-phosphate acyltransferase
VSAEPKRGKRGWLAQRLHHERHAAWGADPGVLDSGAIERTLDRMAFLFGERRYFRLDVRGFENVPPAPAMLVSNHSGGTSIPDVWGFGFAWYTHFGVGRPIHPMAHELLLATRATGQYFAKRGVLRASHDAAKSALLEFRRDVLVMPGGELDTWRPFHRRYSVEFGGRTGYARLALATGVPIVPVAHAGAHDTLMVVTDGRFIANAFGLQKIARARVWPVHLSLPWGLAVGPWPHLPLPTELRYRIGKPIPPLSGNRRPTEADVVELDERVRGSIQSMLDELSEKRR